MTWPERVRHENLDHLVDGYDSSLENHARPHLRGAEFHLVHKYPLVDGVSPADFRGQMEYDDDEDADADEHYNHELQHAMVHRQHEVPPLVVHRTKAGDELLDGSHRNGLGADAGVPHHPAYLHVHARKAAAREPGSVDCWMCGGVGDPLPAGGECGHCDGSGYLTPGDQRAIRAQGAAFRPTQRIFGPTYGLDHRLFSGESLKPEVREHVMGTLAWFWTPIYGPGWHRWSKVYFAGSEASEWTAANLEGNNDFDVLIGIDYDAFRREQDSDADDAAITEVMNGQFKTQLDPLTDHSMIVVDGTPQGPFENTWYVNPDSWDIRDIRPYAAYNVTDDCWAVKPPHLPDWSLEQFPEGAALAQLGEAVSGAIRAVLALPEPYRTQQAVAWWEHLHSDRSRAFTPQGEGWWDVSNVLEKWLDQEGLWSQLWEAKHMAEVDPHALDAPLDWSNDPSVARKETA